jgi:hypothetical protein
MARRHLLFPTAIGLALSALVGASAENHSSQAPKVPIPNPGVDQIMTLEDAYVRVAYNNEGYVTLGYRLANTLVGQEWMFIEVGATLREGKRNFTLKRSAISLSVPDGSKVPLPTDGEYKQVDLRGIEQRSTVVRDSINYFPPSVRDACRLGFFSEMSSRTVAFDEVELSPTRGCLGRLYFKIPGGLKYGQHFLNVQFQESLVRVPFRIVTKDEEKILSKNWKDIRKQVQEAFKKGGSVFP